MQIYIDRNKHQYDEVFTRPHDFPLNGKIGSPDVRADLRSIVGDDYWDTMMDIEEYAPYVWGPLTDDQVLEGMHAVDLSALSRVWSTLPDKLKGPFSTVLAGNLIACDVLGVSTLIRAIEYPPKIVVQPVVPGMVILRTMIYVTHRDVRAAQIDHSFTYNRVSYTIKFLGEDNCLIEATDLLARKEDVDV